MSSSSKSLLLNLLISNSTGLNYDANDIIELLLISRNALNLKHISYNEVLSNLIVSEPLLPWFFCGAGKAPSEFA